MTLAQQTPPGSVREHLSVLLVDDNPHDRDLLARELKGHFIGLGLELARDREELEHALRRGSFDAAVIDHQLRWTTGLEVLRAIKADHPDCPVLMFTASGSEEVAIQAMKAGLDDYITKTAKHYPRIPYALATAIERARERQERLRAEEALREANRRKDTFLATLAHELRNPLAPIRYATRLLEPGVPADLAEKARRMIERQLAQMARLLDDLLDTSRITRGVLQIHRDLVDLRGIVSDAVEAARPMLTEGCRELTVVLPAEPLPVRGDPLRLAQAIGNLLRNAAKYTNPDGHIAVECEQSGSEVIVRVRDDGIGIEPEQLESAFELFTQLDARGRATGGLGIGLSLARQLVELHGGRLEARSPGIGQGSEFMIRLTLAGEKLGPADTVPVGQPAPAHPLSAAQILILIVDDNTDAADSLSSVLTLTGYRCHATYGGEAALETAERLRPDIILLDIGLPDISGLEIARRIRAQPWGRRTRLIAITGWGQESNRRRALDAGCDEHFTKPVDPGALLGYLGAPQGPSER